ncbi:MAG: Nif3-like dinuclear metal center hexameric protein [Prolixibacteraceae bacterium]|nr:Nif3-like dinuclear metal center hexameric protein [Prolixibacteraceae bacterium]
MKIKDIIQCIEEVAPLSLQESWDNSGLIVGNANDEIASAVITIDVTEAVVDDAVTHGDGLIIAHHPVIFTGLKKLNGNTDAERAVIKAIKNNVAIYAAHTNIDMVQNGVSWKMAEKIGLENVYSLSPQKGLLKKLVVFVPSNYAEKVRDALCDAGAGHIGNYDYCTFKLAGKGTFRAGIDTNPFVGQKGEIHVEDEVRVETVFPAYDMGKVITALMKNHPYEEVAYDIYPLENAHPATGLGVAGVLPREYGAEEFLYRLKSIFGCNLVRWAGPGDKTIKKVALCGGAGSSLFPAALKEKADIFVTADYKYHQFFDAEKRIVIADIGHYESEQFTKEVFYEIVTNKFSKFAIRLSEIGTNPVKYLF